MNRWLVLALLLVGCSGGKPPPPAEPGPAGPGKDSMAQQMKPGAPKPSVSWVPGPAVSATEAELVTWFEGQQRGGEPRMTRVPIVMTKGDAGWSTSGVAIGSLSVRIVDTALGMGMAMRAQRCSEATCGFVVEGFWRGKVDGSYEYEIRNAPKSPATAEQLAAVSHLEVEGESGN